MSPRLSILLICLAAGAGCNNKKQPGSVLTEETAGMPVGSRLYTEKSGGFAFAAPEAGKVYIQNASSGKVIYETPVNYADRLLFYPQRKRIILNGAIVREDPSLNDKQVHRLYFAKGKPTGA